MMCRGVGLDPGEGFAPESIHFSRFGGEPYLGYDACFRFDRVQGRERPGLLHEEEQGFGWEGGDLHNKAVACQLKGGARSERAYCPYVLLVCA